MFYFLSSQISYFFVRFSLHVISVLLFFDLRYSFRTYYYVHSKFVFPYFLIPIDLYLFDCLDVESVGLVVVVEVVASPLKFLVASCVESVAVQSMIDTFGSCDPYSHRCSMFYSPFHNFPVLVDGNVHNRDNCPRIAVVLVVRIVVIVLVFAHSVVIVVHGIVVLVANSVVVDTIELVALIVHFVAAADTVEIVADTVANYIVVAD